MASSHASTASTGSDIVLTGLVVQIVLFSFFVVASSVFHRRVTANSMSKSTNDIRNLTKIMYVLYSASSCVLIRCIVRVAEFVEGFEGYIILHESFLYVFDAVPMTAVMGIL